MKLLALVYPGMTLLDLVGPFQAWSFLPGYEAQYVWHGVGAVPTDCGLSVQATHTFEDAWNDPDVLFVGGGAKPTLDLLGDSAAIAFLADRGSRARWVCSVCTGALPLTGRVIELIMQYAPQPPYGTGRPDLADADTLAAARAAMQQAMDGASP